MEAMLQDIRYAVRRLRHSPGFTIVVLLTLALGIGANSAIFSVVNTILLRPLPYRDPGKLVTIFHNYPAQKMEAPVSAPGFKDYRDRTRSFSGVAVETGWPANLTGRGDPERLVGTKVSGKFFSVLGVPPALGRAVSDADDAVGRDRVVVLSDGLWRRAFGARADIVGQSIQLNAVAYQVIGVMPRGFVDPFNAPTEVWSPVAIDPARFVPANYTNEFLNLVARIKPDVATDVAVREMTAFATQLKKDAPNNFSPDWTLEVRTLSDVQTGKIRPALLILLGAVGFVLLIACANVANLLLVRAASRQREVAIRTALGARTSHLVRQLMAESLLLAFGGALLGLAVAYGAVRLLGAASLANVPRSDQLAVDGRVVWFTLVLATLTGVLFGIVPALQVRRTDLQQTLRGNSRGGTADPRSQLVRRALVIAEIALALTLLTGGGLLVKSFARLSDVDPGFRADHLLTFTIALPAAKYPSDTVKAAVWQGLMPRLGAMPGVVAAAGTSVIPFGGGWSTGSFNIEGFTPAPNANSPWGDIRVITPDFFTAMKIPLHRGRVFAPHDDAHGTQVAVVDDEFVRKYFPPNTDVIGKRLYFGNATPDSTTTFITIVGVVGHAMHEGLDADPRIQLYRPVAQSPANAIGQLDVIVRTTADPTRSIGAARAAVHEIDKDLPLARIATVEDRVAASMGQRRLSAILLGTFAALALLLASLGIYGVMAYTVAQRSRELGVRVALGATRQNVLGLVLRQGMTLAAVGTVLGLVGAFGLTRLIATQLYAVKPTDPAVFAGVTGLLVAVAAAATLVPGMRAMRVDPVVAMREE